jgi:hypothetical protein
LTWSDEIFLLCASHPTAPTSPFTEAVAADIKVTWSEPDPQGSAILGYKIFIRAADQVYYEESVYCYAFSATMVAERACSIPNSVLTVAPYSLLKGNSVMARIIAENYYGDSPYSTSGNGAIMIIVPDAPILLENNLLVTNRSTISFNWFDGYSTGGSPVIDYRVSYDQATGIWAVLSENVLVLSYTTSVYLTEGLTYNFRVEARNELGYSAHSVVLPVLCA